VSVRGGVWGHFHAQNRPMPLYLRLRTVFKRVPCIAEQYIQVEMKFTRRGMEGGVSVVWRLGVIFTRKTAPCLLFSECDGVQQRFSPSILKDEAMMGFWSSECFDFRKILSDRRAILHIKSNRPPTSAFGT
jgi:hypothetical protein